MLPTKALAFLLLISLFLFLQCGSLIASFLFYNVDTKMFKSS